MSRTIVHRRALLSPILRATIGATILALVPLSANSQNRGLGDMAPRLEEDGDAVDVELVLAVDVSWSMSNDEQAIQREGYAAAFRSSDVQEAIFDGVHGAVAVTYVEWAGSASQAIVIPWTRIDSRESADAFAYRLATDVPIRARRTSISSGIRFSAGLFEGNGFSGSKRVIDVSGDGPNNQGAPVAAERDRAVGQGIVINGLPLMTRGDEPYGSWGSIANLDAYYAGCVVGGAGHFVIPVNDWSQFPQAVRRKLVLELASNWPADRAGSDGGRRAPVIETAGEPAVDCLVGERLWEDRQRRWLRGGE